MGFGYNSTEVTIRFNDEKGNSLFVWAEQKSREAWYKYVSYDYSSGRQGTGRTEVGPVEINDNSKPVTNLKYVAHLIDGLSIEKLEDAAKAVVALAQMIKSGNKENLTDDKNLKNLIPNLLFENTMNEGDCEWAWVCESCSVDNHLSVQGSDNGDSLCLIKGCKNKTGLVYYLRDSRK